MKKKLRILHIAQAAGGVARYLQMLLQTMGRETCEHILVCSRDYAIGDFADLTDKTEQLDLRRNIGPQDIAATFKLRQLIKRYQPDVVYAHSSKAGALARLANLGLGTVCIYNPHGWAFQMRIHPGKRMCYRLIEKMLAPLCSRIVCISESEKQAALDANICDPEKLLVIPSGIDCSACEKGKHTWADCHIPADAFVVGMVGRLSRQKGPDTFVHMAKIVKARIPDAYFLMVGDGELAEKIRLLAARLGLSDCLQITGWVKEPMEYLAHFDVAVLLSRWEGFGLALAEYMLAEKPIVATAVDAIPELIRQEENGLLVAPEDAAAAAEAVCRLYEDPSLRERLTKDHSRRVRELYDIRRVAEAHRRLFQTCVNKENK